MQRIIVIAGPTAVGKSGFALELAEALGAEIVSIDSVQLYRGLDIGSAKPSAADRARVPHHLIDVLDPDEECHVARFLDLAAAAIEDVASRGKPVVAVGGTNLYLRILIHGIFEAPEPDEKIRAEHRSYVAEHGAPALHAKLAIVDPELAERIHANDAVRSSRGLEVFAQTGRKLSELQDEHQFKSPNYDALKIALTRDRAELYRRIDTRVDAMIELGLEDEYRGLVAAGYGPQHKPMTSLGYRHIGNHVHEDEPLAACVDALKRDTRRFAKQQLSWLRSERDVRWVSTETALAAGAVDDRILADLLGFLEGNPAPDRYTWQTDPP